MSTKFLVGENLVLEDLLARPADEVKKELNTNLDVVDLSEFKSMENMEKYSYETFLRKSKLYLNSNPPDYVQSAEKCWMSSVYAIKELYLSAGGVLLKSHDAMSYGVIFAIESQPNLECQRILFLKGAWGVAQEKSEGNNVKVSSVVIVKGVKEADVSDLMSHMEKFGETFDASVKVENGLCIAVFPYKKPEDANKALTEGKTLNGATLDMEMTMEKLEEIPSTDTNMSANELLAAIPSGVESDDEDLLNE